MIVNPIVNFKINDFFINLIKDNDYILLNLINKEFLIQLLDLILKNYSSEELKIFITIIMSNGKVLFQNQKLLTEIIIQNTNIFKKIIPNLKRGLNGYYFTLNNKKIPLYLNTEYYSSNLEFVIQSLNLCNDLMLKNNTKVIKALETLYNFDQILDIMMIPQIDNQLKIILGKIILNIYIKNNKKDYQIKIIMDNKQQQDLQENKFNNLIQQIISIFY